MKKLSKLSIILLMCFITNLSFVSCTAEDISAETITEVDSKPKTSRTRPLTGFYGDSTEDSTKRRSMVLEDIEGGN